MLFPTLNAVLRCSFRVLTLILVCTALPIAAAAAPCAGSDLQGTVFRDYNADGAFSVGNTEYGIGGAIVTATSADGSSSSCETLADGSYGLDAPAGGFPLRVEVTLPSGGAFDFLEPGAAGLTSTFFASGVSMGLDVGFNEPLDYCQANPDIMASCFLQGDPLFPGSAASMGDTVVSVDYNRTVVPPNHLAVGSQVGAVWGLAYQRSSQKLFASAVLRRHAGYGPMGLAGIYQLDYSGGGLPVVSPFIDVTTLGIPVGTDPRGIAGENLPGSGPTGNEPGLDNLAYENIGKVGIGDIDIEEDASRLWLMSLSDRTLYALDIGPDGDVPASATAYPLPVVSCVEGDFRPWAVKPYRGRMYVGGVCSNEDISNYVVAAGYPGLVGYVYSMDPADGLFSLDLIIPLDYGKGCAGGGAGCAWFPWTNLATHARVPGARFFGYPTPMFTDIEFADDGDMILGFTDRTGFQYGTNSPLANGNPSDATVGTVFGGGDMLRADFDSTTGAFTLESNGIAGGDVGGGSGNLQGPGGGEYYSASTGGFHFELSQGGYAVLRGSNHFVGSAVDPVSFDSGGILWMWEKGALAGLRAAGYTLFNIATPGGFRKGAGAADVELRCELAPIEIGNRVWQDDDYDGVQDAGEPPLSGVTVRLVCAGAGIDVTTTTDVDGSYLFSNANVPGGVPAGAACEVQINPADTALGDLGLTAANSGGNDLHDSDGVLSGGMATVAFTTGGAGANDHSFDVGFAPGDLTLTKTSSPAVPGGSISYTMTVTNLAPGTATGVMVTDNLPVELSNAHTLGCLNDPAGVPVCDLGDIAGYGSAVYSITASVDAALPVGTVIANTATVSAAGGDIVTSNNTGSANASLIAAIPTLSEWGMILFVLMLAIGAVLRLRG